MIIIKHKKKIEIRLILGISKKIWEVNLSPIGFLQSGDMTPILLHIATTILLKIIRKVDTFAESYWFP